MMFETVPDYLKTVAAKHPSRYALYIRRFLRTTRFTYGEMFTLSQKLASFLVHEGLKPGDRVLIWAPNMPEWVLALFGCLSCGIVVVPVGLHSTLEVVEKYISQTNPKILFLSKFFPIDLGFSVHKGIRRIFLEDLVMIVRDVEVKDLPKIHKSALAEIVFTSGTTGEPKGVMISHHNLLYQIEQLIKTVPRFKHYRMLSVLPLSHVMEQVVGLIGPLSRGATIFYIPRINAVTIKKALKKYRITDLGVVPQMMRMFLDTIEYQAKQSGEKPLFDIMLRVARIFPMFMRRSLFSKIHQSLGGKLYVFGVGSAPLDVRLATSWEAMGIKVVEGYGASETTGAVSVNRINKRRLGSVGRKLPGIEIKQDKDTKEILVKGDNVTKGYFLNAEKTKDSFTPDGFFKTGDVGFFDQSGWLYITGREKFKIVTSSGDKIYPEDVERKLNADPNVWDSCVCGIKKNEGEIVYATIILKENAKVTLEDVIKQTNKALEPNQQILDSLLWPERDFPRLHTLKIDRNTVKTMIEAKIAGKDIIQAQTTGDQDKLKEILSTVCKVPQNKINETSILTADLGLDSLKRVELVSLIEEEYEVEVDETAIDRETTVRTLRKIAGIKQEIIKPHYDTGKISSYITNPFRQSFKVLLQNFLVFPFFRFIIKIDFQTETDLKKLRPPFILIGNHLDPGDAVSLLSCLPGKIRSKLLIPADDEHWSGNYLIPYLLTDGDFIQMFGGGFPINKRGGAVGKSLETLVDFLENGHALLFFPEGQYTTPQGEKLGKLRKGISLLVSGTNLPLIPFYVSGNLDKTFPLRTLEKGAFEHFRPRGFSKVAIKIGQPFVVGNKTEDQTMELIRNKILELTPGN